MSRSPLGKYSAIAATAAAISLLGAYVAGHLYRLVFLGDVFALDDLKDLALIAAGAVFAMAAPSDAGTQEVDALHSRLDKLGAPTAAVARTDDGLSDVPEG